MGVENLTATPAGVEYPTSVAIFLKYANKLRFYTQKIRHEIGGVGLPRRILGSNVLVGGHFQLDIKQQSEVGSMNRQLCWSPGMPLPLGGPLPRVLVAQ